MNGMSGLTLDWTGNLLTVAGADGFTF